MLLIALCFMNAVGISLYAFLSIMLMELVFCPDIRHNKVNMIFSRSFAVRLRLFRRSLGSLFYRGTFYIWICCYLIIFLRLQEITSGNLPNFDSLRIIITVVLPSGLILVYRSMGYGVTIFGSRK